MSVICKGQYVSQHRKTELFTISVFFFLNLFISFREREKDRGEGEGMSVCNCYNISDNLFSRCTTTFLLLTDKSTKWHLLQKKVICKWLEYKRKTLQDILS